MPLFCPEQGMSIVRTLRAALGPHLLNPMRTFTTSARAQGLEELIAEPVKECKQVLYSRRPSKEVLGQSTHALVRAVEGPSRRCLDRCLKDGWSHSASKGILSQQSRVQVLSWQGVAHPLAHQRQLSSSHLCVVCVIVAPSGHHPENQRMQRQRVDDDKHAHCPAAATHIMLRLVSYHSCRSSTGKGALEQ